MDILLITQIKCQLITHQLTCPSTDDLLAEDVPKSPSVVVTAALLKQVEDLQRDLPPALASESKYVPLDAIFPCLIAELQKLRSFISIARSSRSNRWRSEGHWHRILPT